MNSSQLTYGYTLNFNNAGDKLLAGHSQSNYNYLWVLTDKYLYKINYNGLIIFKKENKIGSKKIGFYKNDILISNESELYSLENNKELFTKIKIEKLFIKDFFVINETLYIYDKDHLNKYLILSY